MAQSEVIEITVESKAMREIDARLSRLEETSRQFENWAFGPKTTREPTATVQGSVVEMSAREGRVNRELHRHIAVMERESHEQQTAIDRLKADADTLREINGKLLQSVTELQVERDRAGEEMKVLRAELTLMDHILNIPALEGAGSRVLKVKQAITLAQDAQFHAKKCDRLTADNEKRQQDDQIGALIRRDVEKGVSNV